MEYFGFESGDWYEFDGPETFHIYGAVALVCDGDGSPLRGAAETADRVFVTFDFSVLGGFDGWDTCFDINFAPGTFPLPNGYTKAEAEVMIRDNFDSYSASVLAPA